jgi:hypothetical protein
MVRANRLFIKAYRAHSLITRPKSHIWLTLEKLATCSLLHISEMNRDNC